MGRDKQNLLFFGTHNHTEFSNVGSFLDSIIKVKDLLLKAHELGYCGIAFTEHGNICSHIQAITVSKQLKKEGKLPQEFVVGLGVEAYIVDEHEMKQAVENNQPTSFYHTVIIAKDEVGHEQIRKLVTASYERSFTYRGILRVPMFYSDFETIIGEDKGHLIVTSACLGGFMGKTVSRMLKHDNEEDRKPFKESIYQYMNWAFDMFGNDFYYELQPSFNEEQVAYNQMLVKIAKAYQVKLTVATDTHYLTKEDKEIHEAFLTSDKNGEGGRELGDFYDDTYLHTIDEMFEKLNYLEENDVIEAINNTRLIASQIKDYDLAHPQIVPKIPLPPRSEWVIHEEFYELAKDYEYIQAMIDSNEPQDNYLINQVFNGFYEKEVPQYKYQEKLERLNIECKELLGISKAKGQPMSAYFVTLQKCMDLIWEEAGSIVCVGRGSSVGWELNYLLNIVQISPLEQGITLPHWRFLTSERVDLPK